MTMSRPNSFSPREFLVVFRRRWRYVAYSVGVVTFLSLVGAFILTRKYEATTTILVRPDKTLNPIPSYGMVMAFEEQLRNFSEILYSRSLLMGLADSLGLDISAKTTQERQLIASQLANNISTTRLGSDSFKITYTDTEPYRTLRGAQVVAHLFIQTKLNVENIQNTLAVEFYEQKVREYKADYESSVKMYVSRIRQRDLPLVGGTIYTRIDAVEKELATLDAELRSYEEKMTILQKLPQILQTSPELLRKEDGKQPLFELTRSTLPYAADLKVLVTQYDQITRSYSGNYPEVKKLENQIEEMLQRMLAATESEIASVQSQQRKLESQRSGLVDDLKKTSVAQKESQDTESAFDINKKLYDDMKLKLEQARLAEEVGSRGANQFIVLDPPVLPITPTKPNRMLIVLGGMAGGLLLGIIAAFLSELLDTTVRSTRDIEVFQRPIVAFLPEGTGTSL
jgi:uncharacterized protein involved in exopolysaccharide biosynthesis